MTSDVVIIGGGFFGARIALELGRAGQKVTLLEREPELMQRASFTNQARVHGGYHYPRSLLTALRSRVNLPEFSKEYANCIDDSFDQYYAIANDFSKVSGQQFQLFCERIEAPIRRAPDRVKQLFNDSLIDEVFTVEEYAFDSTKIKNQLMRQMDEAGVTWLTKSEVKNVRSGKGGLSVRFDQNGYEDEIICSRALNCTYSRINDLNRKSGLTELPLKHEIAEIALVEPPPELHSAGVTVMCGPFFSTMPFPARGLYSFTHVRYTPHTEWYERPGEPAHDPYEYLEKIMKQSTYPKMLADAKRYLPCLEGAKYVESIFEVKTVLPQSEGDDSRPILYKANHGGLTGYACIMGGKLDNVYDVLKELAF